jgi:serine/threonine protein kinase
MGVACVPRSLGELMPIDIAWLQQTFPDLQNLQLLNRGGQKEVFSARHRSEGDVVLKLINPLQDPESVRREILAVAKVQSSRVPRILDQGQLQTQFGTVVWLREERVLGDSLRHILGTGPLAAPEVVGLGVQMLEALAQAETVQIVHRDVKPENIMRDSQGNYCAIIYFTQGNRSAILSSCLIPAPTWRCAS